MTSATNPFHTIFIRLWWCGTPNCEYAVADLLPKKYVYLNYGYNCQSIFGDMFSPVTHARVTSATNPSYTIFIRLWWSGTPKCAYVVADLLPKKYIFIFSVKTTRSSLTSWFISLGAASQFRKLQSWGSIFIDFAVLIPSRTSFIHVGLCNVIFLYH